MRYFLFILFLSLDLTAQTSSSYDEVTSEWRSLVDEARYSFDEVLESDAESTLEQLGHDNHMDELDSISLKRSQYISDRYDEDKWKVLSFDKNFFSDLKREIKIVPFKWYSIFVLKGKTLRSYLNTGFDGYAKLIIEIIKIFSVFFFPFFAWWFSKKISEILKRKRTGYVKLSYRGYKSYSFVSEIMRLAIIYLPWLIALVSLYIMVWLLSQSESLHEFSDFVSFFKYFIYYKILKRVLYDILVRVGKTRMRHKQELLQLQDKATKHASRFGALLMWTFFLLDFVKSVVSKGLSYYLIQNIAIILIIFIGLFIAAQWREELSQKLKAFSLPHLSTWFSELVSQKKFFFLSLPALIIVVGINLLQTLLSWSEKFDFVKKITAQILKKRLESSDSLVEEKAIKVPDEYFEHFEQEIESDPSLYVNPESNILEEIIKVINLWKEDETEENSMAIIGDKGAGKSTLLSMLAKNFKGLDVKKVEMKKRISTSKELFDFIYDALGIEGEGIISLIKYDKECQQTLVLIDEVQNCFISKLGGFNAYKALLEVLNTKLENIFFCISFNRYSWNYLNASFGKNQSFRNIKSLQPLSDGDIRKIIMKRHNKCEYGLSCLNIMKAVGGKFASESQEIIEEQFFRLLWEQSLGNPRVSISNWLSSLKYDGRNKFYLGLPQDDDLSTILDKLSEDALFALAAIVKHENLSVKEVMEITHLSEGAVRYAIKFGIDNKILVMKDKLTYTLKTRFQNSLIKYLEKKNLVYGE